MRGYLVAVFPTVLILDSVRSAVIDRCTDGQIMHKDAYQTYCDPCPKGYYCLSGVAVECGPGNYCPMAAAMPTK